MAAGAWQVYNDFLRGVGVGDLDIDGDDFKCVLLTSSYTPTATHAAYADLSGELSTANGYTNGGKSLTGVTFTESGGTTTMDCADISWDIDTASISARYAVIYDNTDAGKQLVCVCLLNNAPADVTADPGDTFVVAIHADGLFDFTGGW